MEDTISLIFCASRSYPTHFFFAFCTNLLIHLVLDYAKKPLTSDEAVQIQNLLKVALEELTDDHVLLVLKRSLLLYFKVCLYPYPAPHLVKLSGREGNLESITTRDLISLSKLFCPLLIT